MSLTIRKERKKIWCPLSLGIHREQATSVKFKAINLVLAPWRLSWNICFHAHMKIRTQLSFQGLKNNKMTQKVNKRKCNISCISFPVPFSLCFMSTWVHEGLLRPFRGSLNGREKKEVEIIRTLFGGENFKPSSFT